MASDAYNYEATPQEDYIDTWLYPFNVLSQAVYRLGSGNDQIRTNRSITIVGGAGDDTIIGFGQNALVGIKYDESPSGIEVNAAIGEVKDGYGSTDRISGVLDFFGSANNDLIIGSIRNESFGSRFYPPQGNDTYIGGGGYDVVYYALSSSDVVVEKDSTKDQAIVKELKNGPLDLLKGISEIRLIDKSIKLSTHTASRDVYFGSPMSDDFQGGMNPFFIGTGGDSYLGAEGFDTISYPGRKEDYMVAQQSDGSQTVSWLKSSGIDVLKNIEMIRFSDSAILMNAQKIPSETVLGGLENDILVSSSTRYNLPGSSNLYVGNTGFDVVKYSNPSGSYKIQTDSTGNVSVIEISSNNIDRLQGIEGIRFLEGFYPISQASVSPYTAAIFQNPPWEHISEIRKMISDALGKRPVGFNLDKVWYDNFQVPSSLIQRSATTIKTSSLADTSVGYGTYAVNPDGSVTVVSGGWKPDVPSAGRLYQAVIKDGIVIDGDIKAIEGATHYYTYRDGMGRQRIIGLGSDEGKSILDYSVKDRVGEVISGNPSSSSFIVDPLTLSVNEVPNLYLYAHNSHSFDIDNDGLLDFVTNDKRGSLIINKGSSFVQIPLFTAEKLEVGGSAIGWLGRQPDGSFGFVITDSSSKDPRFPPERNVIVYTDNSFQEIQRTQLLPLSIFEESVYEGLPEVYLGWNGTLGTSHDMNIRIKDINADGLLDILIGEKIAASNLPSGVDASFGAIQIIIAQSDGTYVDETNTRLFNFDTTFSGPHHFEFHDINGDGFEDILTAEYSIRALAGPAEFSPIRHAFFALINDGTGHYISAIHQQLADLQTDQQIKAQFGVDAQGKPFWVGWDYAATSTTIRVLSLNQPLSTGPKFEDPASQGAPGFNEFYYLLNNADVQKAVSDGLVPNGLAHFLRNGQKEGRMAFALNAWVHGSDQSDTIKLREGNEKAFGYEGDDNFAGLAGNDTLDGGSGVDQAVYTGTQSDYQLVKQADSNWAVTDQRVFAQVVGGPQGDGIDQLVSMERLKFSDKSIAIDLDGNAGNAARTLATVFGKVALKNTTYAGIAISLFDQGMTKDQVSQVTINAVFGANPKSTDVVKLLWKNLFNADIDASNLAYYSGLIDSKAMTAAQLTTLAADLDLTAQVIDLAGLSKTGWEYVPFGT